MDIVCWDGEEEGPCDTVETIYIPSHLEEITYNTIKNAMRATIEQNSDSLPPVNILISKGKNNITIKVSDRGGGASMAQQKRWISADFGVVLVF